jgi:S1-C subfamily serine protease
MYALFLAMGSAAGLTAGQYLNASKFDSRVELPSETSKPAIAQQPQASALPFLNQTTNSAFSANFIASAVERVGPAVVRIDASRTVTQSVPDAFRGPFRQFFGDDLPSPQERIEEGTGSGFILSADGQIMTNAHVVEGADRVMVTLKDGRELDGNVVGADPITDVAVIKIEATDLPTVSIGSSETLIPGQWAIAIGNPFGLDNTVTAGIISATGRSSSQVGVPDRRVRFIQTDAAINPGNSGGPLLNDKGEVIGINTAIRANAQGLGFAIPIETASRVATQLFATGRMQHPYLGIQMVELSPVLRDRINQEGVLDRQITRESGVLIMDVVQGGPAAQAGIRPGDIVLKVGGNPVTSSEDVQDRVENSAIGQPLEVEIDRQGQVQTFQIRPSEMPARLAE